MMPNKLHLPITSNVNDRSEFIRHSHPQLILWKILGIARYQQGMFAFGTGVN